MNYKLFIKCLLTITFLFCALTAVQAQDINQPELNPPGENVILQWNRVLQETIRTPGQHPATIFPVRSFAMMHAAMFDAINSIDRTYTPYLTDCLLMFSYLSQLEMSAKFGHFQKLSMLTIKGLPTGEKQ